MRLIFLLFVLAPAAHSVPTVPTFSSGTLTSSQTTVSKITETIVSHDVNSGYQYSVSGTGVEPVNSDLIISPVPKLLEEQKIEGTTFSYTSVDITPENKPQWKLTTPGVSFNFSETLVSPGLANVTTIQREENIETMVESVSVFTQ
tara:strand:- start:585 stop:1022 length:438 start_codon:yes stop_codon:yes gene_type:complete